MANLTPTEMVAADQLYRAAIQKVNANIAEKQDQLNNIACVQRMARNENIDCEKCQFKSTCGVKTTVNELIADINKGIGNKTSLMKNYSKLQDDIMKYLNPDEQ